MHATHIAKDICHLVVNFWNRFLFLKSYERFHAWFFSSQQNCRHGHRPQECTMMYHDIHACMHVYVYLYVHINSQAIVPPCAHYTAVCQKAVFGLVFGAWVYVFICMYICTLGSFICLLGQFPSLTNPLRICLLSLLVNLLITCFARFLSLHSYMIYSYVKRVVSKKLEPEPVCVRTCNVHVYPPIDTSTHMNTRIVRNKRPSIYIYYSQTYKHITYTHKYTFISSCAS